MSIREDVGQILWLGFEGQEVPQALARDIATGDVGAVILFRRNIAHLPGHAEDGVANATTDTTTNEVADIRALVELNRALHRCAPSDGPPLWIAVDQEGGRVMRVRAPAPSWPAMLSLGGADTAPEHPADHPAEHPADHPAEHPADTRAEERCERVGLAMGRELQALGFDVDFAPVLDVHTNPANPIIGDRAFAGEPEAAARYALAFARGLERAGIVGCGKHFPGHGDTDMDSHLALPRLDHDMDRLRRVELLPFMRAVAANIPMLMTAHVIFAALDERLPATLSRRVITGLLRDEFGFSGIVVSDDLDMRAIAAHFGIGEAAVQAVRAGCDVLLLCRDPAHQHEAREALIHAAERDAGLRARAHEAANRVRTAKERHAGRILPASDADRAHALFAEHRALAPFR